MLTKLGRGVFASVVWLTLATWLFPNPVFTSTSLLLAALVALELFLFRLRIRDASMIRIQCEVERGKTFVREVLRLSFLVTNEGKRKVGSLCIVERLSEGLKGLSSDPKKLIEVGPGEKTLFTTRIEAFKRGRQNVEGFSVLLFDPFMLFVHQRDYPVTIRVDVYPRIPITVAQYARKREILQVIGDRASGTKGLGSEFYGIREYSSGDDIRFLAWKFMAKKPDQSPMTKEYEKETRVGIALAFSCNASMAEGFDGNTKMDRAIEAALALSYEAGQNRDSASIFFRRDGSPALLAGGRGMQQVYDALENLYDLQAGGFVEPEIFLREVFSHVRRRTGLILLIDVDEALRMDPRQLYEIGYFLAGVRLVILDNAAFQGQPETSETVSALAFSVLREREKLRVEEAVQRFRRHGVEARSCDPQNLAREVVEAYDSMRGGRT